MSNINNLTKKIIQDANITSEKLIQEAKATEKTTIDKKISEAEYEKKRIILKSKEENDIKFGRIISNAKLNVRNMKLAAKGEILNKVFNDAREKLDNLSKDDLLKFIKKSILSLDIDGDEEIILGKNSELITEEFLDEVNNLLKSRGKIGNLKISTEERDISGGYILYKNGVEINNTFEVLVKSLRGEMESEIANALFT